MEKCEILPILPFPLAGSPEDRIEKLLNAAQRILLKMKVTENPVYLLQPQQVDELEKDLWDLRSEIYFNRICGGDQHSSIIFKAVLQTLSGLPPQAPGKPLLDRHTSTTSKYVETTTNLWQHWRC